MIIEFDTSEYLPHQKKFFSSNKRYKALVSGFGGGKSHIFLRETLKNHLTLTNKDGFSNGWILYPTYDLAEEIFIYPFIDLLEEAQIEYDYNIAKHKFTTSYGVIKIYQMQKPSRIIGSNLTFVGADEFDVESIKNCQQTFDKAIARLRGCKNPVFYIVTTPEGFKVTYKIFVEQATESKDLIKAKTTDNPHLPENYIESLRENYDEKLVEQYINGEFVNISQGQVYYSYDRELNNTDREYDPALPIDLCMDFNVSPMCWTISQNYKGYDYVVDEIIKKNTNTIEMAQAVCDKYGKYTHYTIYGDYSGTARDTRSRTTDYELIEQILPNNEMNVKFNPPVVDRVNAVNARLCNSKKERKLFVNKDQCPTLVKDLEQVSYKEGKREIDKTNIDLTHASDGLGYMIEYKYGLKGKPKVSHTYGR